MSFQRKTVSLTGTSQGQGRPIITPNRGQPIRPHPSGPTSNIGANTQRVIPGRIPTTIGARSVEIPGRGVEKNVSKTTPTKTVDIQRHVAVKTSIQISDLPTISTGSPDLDHLLGHNGIPLGSILVIEELGNTDFASILLRSAASQSVMHTRMGNKQHLTNTQGGYGSETNDSFFSSKVIAVGVDESWGVELPGEYRDKKQAKKEKIEKEQKRITVQNLAQVQSPSSSGSHSSEVSHNPNIENVGSNESGGNMKIAWRYGRQALGSDSKGGSDSNIITESKPNYVSTFDFTTRLVPGPSPKEIDYIGGPLYFMSPLMTSSSSYLDAVFKKIRDTIIKTLQTEGSHTIIRVLIPSILHPATYPPESATPQEAIKFFHSLLHLARKEFPQNVIVMLSLSSELFPRETYLTRWLEILSDGVVHIDPFPERLDITQGPEIQSGNDAESSSDDNTTKSSQDSSKNKPYQGLIHVYKLPILSERGGMHVRKSEYAFRVSRKKFEIDEWGIPVEDEDESVKPPSSSNNSSTTIDKKSTELDINLAENTITTSSTTTGDKAEAKKTKPAISKLSAKDLEF